MNENACNLIQSNTSQSLSAAAVLRKIVLSASCKEFVVRPMPEFNPNIWLHNDDSLSDYGIHARIISLPGHMDGSIGIDVDKKYLIAGDAGTNMFYPTVSMRYHSRDNMLERARKISSIGNRTIYFVPGKPVTDKQRVK
ncbi:MAG: hypothetical protein HFE84_09860 [Lachnospiraceae bacterium]|nr:hypothetical protein [Lachnospiraceae bacterium]